MKLSLSTLTFLKNLGDQQACQALNLWDVRADFSDPPRMPVIQWIGISKIFKIDSEKVFYPK